MALIVIWDLLAAYRAAATSFSLLRQRKGSKRKTTLLPVSLWALLRKTQAGNLRCSITGWGRRTRCALDKRFAQTTAASQITKQMRPAAHLPTLRSARLGTGRRGDLSTALSSADAAGGRLECKVMANFLCGEQFFSRSKDAKIHVR